ncbi:MAG: helix-turn-helix domain-containing protein [Actinomycetota bacterium]|nr:helix-turn-helix domain-containing protein [Actinomycetota bacterium]
MPKSTGENWMGVPAAAEYLGVVLHTVYKLIHEDKIRAYKIGRVIRLRKADVDAYLEAHVIEPGSLGHLVDPPARPAKRKPKR